jgi:D-lactate dehydrogenase
MPTPDVFFYEVFAEEEPALKRFMPAAWKAGYTAATIRESGHTAPPAPVISIRTQSEVPPAWDARLKAVHSRSTGYDHLLPLRHRAQDRLRLGALPKYCGRAVAEQAILLMLALLRKLPRQLQSFPRFSRDGLSGGEAAGRNLLVVGVGDIGHHVVEIGRGLGMTVQGVDPVRRHAGVTYVDIDAGIAKADVIVSAMNLNESNRSYFRRELFLHARPGALFINVGRGECSPAPVLLALLEEGRLGGVGLDVYNDEHRVATALRAGIDDPGSAEWVALHRLAARPDVLLTPHNAFNTAEAVLRKSDLTARQIGHVLSSGRFLWPLEI